MAKLKDITIFLDDELDSSMFDDSSHNGLQVESQKAIKKIGFAVDACMETFFKAKQLNCDLLITHHGLFWNKKETITGNLYQRLKFLMDNNIAIYTSHLPLDAHKKYGNNAQLFKLLGAKIDAPFGGVGFVGSFKTKKKVKDIANLLTKSLNARCEIMKYGKDSVSTVAVLSGGAQFQTFEAIAQNVDLFITGELGHAIYHDVKEAGINVIGAGHYATELLGVKALMPLLKKNFNTQVIFIDSPTGL